MTCRLFPVQVLQEESLWEAVVSRPVRRVMPETALSGSHSAPRRSTATCCKKLNSSSSHLDPRFYRKSQGTQHSWRIQVFWRRLVFGSVQYLTSTSQCQRWSSIEPLTITTLAFCQMLEAADNAGFMQWNHKWIHDSWHAMPARFDIVKTFEREAQQNTFHLCL